MTEIPEHLRKRAEEARKKAESQAPAPEPAAGSDAPSDGAGASKIPAHLLERSKSAKSRGAEAAVAPAGAGGQVAAAVAVADAPVMTGAGGHTQRLLTVVKSGSIQDVKMSPQDKVHTWPHLIV